MKKYLVLLMFAVTFSLGSGIWPVIANAAVYTCPAQAEGAGGPFDGAILLTDNKTVWCLYKDNNSPVLKKFEHPVTIKHPWDTLSKGGGFCMVGSDLPARPLDCSVNVNDSAIHK